MISTTRRSFCFSRGAFLQLFSNSQTCGILLFFLKLRSGVGGVCASPRLPYSDEPADCAVANIVRARYVC